MSKRKAYRPRAARTDVLYLAMQGQAKLAPADQAAMAAPVQAAVENIRKGEAVTADWQAVFDVLNMLDRFCTMPTVLRHGADYLNDMQGVVVQILDRKKATGTKALRANELEDLRGLVDLWVDLLSTVTHREYFLAQERSIAKLQTVLRSSKVPGGVRIVEAA